MCCTTWLRVFAAITKVPMHQRERQPGSLVVRRLRRGATVAWLVILTSLSCGAAGAHAGSPIDLGAADPFAVLGATTVTDAGVSTISGDLGVSPGTAVTGVPPGSVSGSIRLGSDAASAHADLATAYGTAAGRSPAQPVAGLVTQTLGPGVYATGAGLALAGTLTLDGHGDPGAVFIFQAGSTLTTAAGSQVALTGGAQACNVFWQVGSSATLGTASTFRGSVLALTSITATTGATVDGRLLARNAAVTLDSNTITRSRCATPTPSPTPSADRTAPRVRLTIPRRCVSRGFTARFRVSDASGIRRVDVFLDGRRIRRTSRTRFSVRISAARLRAARHTIRVVATDRAGNRRTARRSFTRCAAAIPRFTG